MKLHILFGFRAERYPGQYAPEPITCWSEYEVEDNPVGFKTDMELPRPEFVRTRLFEVTVNEDEIRK